MKNLWILVSILWGMNACNQPQGYKITGSLPGAKDGTVVKLLSEDIYPPQLLDSVVVKNEKFVIQGSTPWAYPKYCRLLVDPTPEITDEYQKQLKSFSFFADNKAMIFECPLDSMRSHFWDPNPPQYQPVLTGSQTQDLYLDYENRTKEWSKKSGDLWEKYLEVYHRPAINGVFNTEEGMKIVRERKQVREMLNQKTIEFIREHPNSVVSLLLIRDVLYRSLTQMTVAQIKELWNTLDPALQDAPMMVQVNEIKDKALLLAQGKKYKDIVLTDLDGKQVKLSDYVKPGTYNMLEFWASWCGPCRGEIPHLRHVYEVCGKDHFNMISISIDERDADWKKAVKEENMAWTQLCDQQGRKGPVADVYKLAGVPYCLILDSEGRIVIGGVRGAELDVVLQDALGEKAAKL